MVTWVALLWTLLLLLLFFLFTCLFCLFFVFIYFLFIHLFNFSVVSTVILIFAVVFVIATVAFVVAVGVCVCVCVCVCVFVCVCACVYVYNFPLWRVLPTSRRLRHTLEVWINDIMLWVLFLELLPSSFISISKYVIFHLRRTNSSLPKTIWYNAPRKNDINWYRI